MRSLFLCFALAGCTATWTEPDHAHRLERPWGLATAASSAEAERLARVVERARALYAELDGFEERPLRIHMADGPLRESMSGVTLTREDGPAWILIDPTDEEIDHTTAHELAHFYFQRCFEALPQLIEEGLCEELASRAVEGEELFLARITYTAVNYLEAFSLTIEGPGARQVLAHLVLELPPIGAALALSDLELLGIEAGARSALYGLGWVLVRRIGLDGLQALVQRTRAEGLDKVPIIWILQAAELDPPTQTALHAVFAHALGSSGDEGPLKIVISTEARAGE